MANLAKTPPTIVDQFGRYYKQGDPWGGAFDPPRDALRAGSKAEAATAFYRDIPISTVSSYWSIDGIRQALQSHRIGLFDTVSLLCDSVFADDRVQATLGSRTGGLFSQPIRHELPAGGGSAARDVRRAWRKQWPKICPQSVMSELMRWAVMLGFAIAEIRWDTSVTPWQPYLKPWHPLYFMYRWDLRQYQLSTLDGPVAAIPGGGKWLLFTPHGSYRGWIQGAIRATAERWFLKQLAWRDWARFNERHGLPMIKAKVPAAGDPIQKGNFVRSMQSLGQESVVGLPQNVDGTGYDVDLLEAKDRAWESFPGMIDRCDRSLVLPILWQNLTTEVKEGSLAAARVHGDVRQNAIEFDNETLSEAIYEQVSRPWALFNFGDPELATRTRWDVRPVEDFVAKSMALMNFAKAMSDLRTAGLAPKYIEALASKFGLTLGEIESVDPVQVEARQAGKTGKVDDKPESIAALRAAYRDIRHHVRQYEAALKRAA